MLIPSLAKPFLPPQLFLVAACLAPVPVLHALSQRVCGLQCAPHLGGRQNRHSTLHKKGGTSKKLQRVMYSGDAKGGKTHCAASRQEVRGEEKRPGRRALPGSCGKTSSIWQVACTGVWDGVRDGVVEWTALKKERVGARSGLLAAAGKPSVHGPGLAGRVLPGAGPRLQWQPHQPPRRLPAAAVQPAGLAAQAASQPCSWACAFHWPNSSASSGQQQR